MRARLLSGWCLYILASLSAGWALAVIAREIKKRLEPLDMMEALTGFSGNPARQRRLRLAYRLFDMGEYFLPTFVVAAILYRSELVPSVVGLFDRSSLMGRSSLTVALLLVGGGLYLLRLKQRRLYAMTELSVAGVSAHASLAPENDLAQPASLLGIATAVYLVVRGLDNLAVGAKEAKMAEEARAASRRLEGSG